jgi:hypothetical protein
MVLRTWILPRNGFHFKEEVWLFGAFLALDIFEFTGKKDPYAALVTTFQPYLSLDQMLDWLGSLSLRFGLVLY